MKNCTLSLLMLLFHIGLAAQQEVIVFRVSGQVQYFTHHGATPVLLQPGMELGLSGKLRCKGSATAKLLYKGSTYNLSGSNMRDVQEVVKAGKEASQMSFTGRFFSFITESVKDSERKEKLQKHHRRYMNKASGGVKGYATPDYAISALLLTTGKLPAANVIFKWRNTAGEGPYTFRLFATNGDQVAQILVRDTAITLDLEQLSIDIFAEYAWNITRGASLKSAAMSFEVCPDKAKEVEKEISQDADFIAADPVEQQLMLAYALEEEHCFYETNRIYAELYGANPDNPLLRKLYASFLARMDMLPEAITLMGH